MPRKDQGWITFQLPEAERQRLEAYCEQTQRSKTDVLRELVRTLDQPRVEAEVAVASSGSASAIHRQARSPQAMRVSARNVFPAQIRQVRLGDVNAEVTLEIAPGIEMVPVITRASADSLRLVQEKDVYAVIKSSDVMVAVDD